MVLSLVSCPSRRSRMAILALPHMGPHLGAVPAHPLDGRDRGGGPSGAARAPGTARSRFGARGPSVRRGARDADRGGGIGGAQALAPCRRRTASPRVICRGRPKVRMGVLLHADVRHQQRRRPPTLHREEGRPASSHIRLNSNTKPGKEAVMALRRRPDGARVGAAASRRRVLRAGHDAASRRKNGPGAPPLDPGGREVKTQEASSRYRASVRATRNPLKLPRSPVSSLPRLAERRPPGSSAQEPPRRTRAEQFPDSHALPSLGAPE